MWVCSCGYANLDDAVPCTACGQPRAEDAAAGPQSDGGSSDTGCAAAAETSPAHPSLVLENLRTGETVVVAAPGGAIGRSGDFSPESFSPCVSGTHLIARPGADHWTLAFVGRNATALNVGGTWTRMDVGAAYPVFGGELLRMADMLFQVRLRTAGAGPEDGSARRPEPAMREGGPEEAPSGPVGEGTAADAGAQGAGKATAWSVRCPVCGTDHPVAGPDERVAACTRCADPLDRRRIARVPPRPLETQEE